MLGPKAEGLDDAMGELTGADMEASESLGTHQSLADRIDDLRLNLPVTARRSRLLDFRAFSKTCAATQIATAPGDPPSWSIKIGPKRLMYDIRKASEAGTLTLYSDFLSYRRPRETFARSAPLLSTPVLYDAARAIVSASGPAKPNEELLKLLSDLKVQVDIEDGRASIRSAGAAAASLEHHSRVGPAPDSPPDLRGYLDHRENPAILRNGLLRLFVDRSASEPSASTVASERPPQAKDHSGFPASERRPQAEHTPDGGRSTLDADQQRAVETAFSSRTSMIDGPPGTGKSTVITAITDRARAAGLSVMITSTEQSAIDVARQRLGNGFPQGTVLTIGTPAEIAASRPSVIGEPDHDLLIVDEASRMPLSIAATMIIRARSIVVIGDDCQMRPDIESVTLLDAAIELRIPRTSLRFHYRSQERSLIMPSNLLAYDMLLRTVPTPLLSPSFGLDVAYVKGATRSSNLGSVNDAECSAIVADLKLIAAKEGFQTIGVVTSNAAQAYLIAASIKNALSPDERDRLNHNMQEPMFVRPVSEVQGEERDIILVSLVYQGRTDRRSGILDTPNGVRAMNVMLSRARRMMTIYTSYETRHRSDWSYGSIILENLHRIIDVASTTETRQMTPPCFQEAARRAEMQIDHLGTVLGLREKGSNHYSVGIIMPTTEKDPEHWDGIRQQLASQGWKTITASENDCKASMSTVVDKIRQVLAAQRRERHREIQPTVQDR